MAAENFELREEVKRGSDKYFLHTTFHRDGNRVNTRYYKDGKCFNTEERSFESGAVSEDQAVSLAKSFHNKNRDNFALLLDTREKLRDSQRSSEHIKMARALYLKNLFAEAIEEAGIAIDKGEEGAEPYKIIADAYFGLERLEEAMDAVDKGLALTDGYPDLYNLRGKIYYRRDQCRSAMEAFNKAIELNCYYGEPYLNILRTYARNSLIKQDYELSRDMKKGFENYLDKAASLNPGFNAGAAGAIKKMNREEDFEGILEQLKVDRSKPAHRDVDDTVVSLYITILRSGTDIEEEEIDHYLKRIEKLINQNPNYPDLFNSLGVLYVAKSRIIMDKASEAFSHALEINTDYEKAKRNIRLSENERQGIFILLKALLD